MNLLRTVLFIFPLQCLMAQTPITINQDDMPGGGDHFIISNSIQLLRIDMDSGGPNMTWDYTYLVAASQTADTFLSMKDVPDTYKLLLFSGANLAQPNAQFVHNEDVTVSADRTYRFYAVGSGSMAQVAYGFNLNGTDIPVPFDTNDMKYQFPLNYGDSNRSRSFFKLPSLFPVTFEQRHLRISKADAWGVLKTPYGSFETIRIKSENYYQDSVELNGVGILLPTVRLITYQWLARGGGVPILEITGSDVTGTFEATSIRYLDSLRTVSPPTGVAEAGDHGEGLFLYPNPATDGIHVRNTTGAGTVNYYVADVSGRIHLHGRLKLQAENNYIPLRGISPGNYFMVFSFPGRQVVRRFVVNPD